MFQTRKTASDFKYGRPEPRVSKKKRPIMFQIGIAASRFQPKRQTEFQKTNATEKMFLLPKNGGLRRAARLAGRPFFQRGIDVRDVQRVRALFRTYHFGHLPDAIPRI